jgi:hypothetical protein
MCLPAVPDKLLEGSDRQRYSHVAPILGNTTAACLFPKTAVEGDTRARAAAPTGTARHGGCSARLPSWCSQYRSCPRKRSSKPWSTSSTHDTPPVDFAPQCTRGAFSCWPGWFNGLTITNKANGQHCRPFALSIKPCLWYAGKDSGPGTLVHRGATAETAGHTAAPGSQIGMSSGDTLCHPICSAFCRPCCFRLILATWCNNTTSR